MTGKNIDGKSRLVIGAVILLLFLIAAHYYPQMPARMAVNWNTAGEVDAYMPRLWGLFLIPLISVALAALLLMLPNLAPEKTRDGEFRRYYYIFVSLILVYLAYLQTLIVLWNLGARVNVVQMIAPAFGLLLYYFGMFLGRSKRDWLIAIRTPWTLSNARVWDKTHLFGGRFLKLAGVATILGTGLTSLTILFVIGPAILAYLCIVTYSYVLSRRAQAGT